MNMEKLKSNNFVINVVGTDIPHELFQSYRMYNEGKTIIVETEFHETEDYIFNPQEFFDIQDLLIQNLDENREVISTYDFSIDKIFYEKSCSLNDEGFAVNKLKFITNNCNVITNVDDSFEEIHDETDDLDIQD